MHGDQRTIREIVKKVRESEGGRILAVICTDGKYGISRNGKLLTSLEWPADQHAECIAFAERFSQTNHFSDGQGFAQPET